MVSREEALATVVSPARRLRAERQATAFHRFCERLALDESAESVAMYLTAAYLDGESGRAVGQRLHILDLDRRLQGMTPWLQDQAVKTLLRGMYVRDPVGEWR